LTSLYPQPYNLMQKGLNNNTLSFQKDMVSNKNWLVVKGIYDNSARGKISVIGADSIP